MRDLNQLETTTTTTTPTNRSDSMPKRQNSEMTRSTPSHSPPPTCSAPPHSPPHSPPPCSVNKVVYSHAKNRDISTAAMNAGTATMITTAAAATITTATAAANQPFDCPYFGKYLILFTRNTLTEMCYDEVNNLAKMFSSTTTILSSSSSTSSSSKSLVLRRIPDDGESPLAIVENSEVCELNGNVRNQGRSIYVVLCLTSRCIAYTHSSMSL